MGEAATQPGTAVRSTAVRGLLLDYGGVLTTSEADALAAFCERSGIESEWLNGLFDSAYELGAPHGPIARVERGEIALADFERWLAATLSERCGRPFESEGLKDELFAGTVREEGIVRVVRLARAAGIRTALVSNSWGGDGSGTYEQDGVADLFDTIVISGREGVRKPEPGIYLLAAERLELPPEACLFVDDLAACVDGAGAVGMTGVLHVDAETTIRRLMQLIEPQPV